MSLDPIRMYPAYRYGAMTPWGGDNLQLIFGKDIPDSRTGECLEVSAIPGLESRDEMGNTLPQLIEKYGEKLVGTHVQGVFPLLLKLLDAKDTLSVQVHPDDVYAAKVENKLGKTEAWYILYADEGAELVYGVNPGLNKETLTEHSRAGKAVEADLRRVKVKAGETYFIPAGMVHAIGGGIVLYEIQQSSDVTYRFYDWDRTDKEGKKRELHIEKAVDVTDLSAQLDKAVGKPMEAGREKLLCEKYFSLEKFTHYQGVIEKDEKRFAILTALKPSRLFWEGGEMQLQSGETVLLPADGHTLVLDTDEALMSYPTV